MFGGDIPFDQLWKQTTSREKRVSNYYIASGERFNSTDGCDVNRFPIGFVARFGLVLIARHT